MLCAKSPTDDVRYQPESYWCPDCWKWRIDCEHLVEPLRRPYVKLSGGMYIEAAYDRSRQILEVRTNTGEGFQYSGVSLEVAKAFVKTERPVEFLKEVYPRAKFRRVRGRLLRC